MRSVTSSWTRTWSLWPGEAEHTGAVAFDLKAFFTVIGKDPVQVTAADVFEFLADQRGDRSVIRLADRESGLPPLGRSRDGWRRCRACIPTWSPPRSTCS